MEYIRRCFDFDSVIARKSLFLFGPRQTGKTSYIKNQLLKEREVGLYWTLLDGRLRISLESDIGLLRQEVEIRNLHDCLIVIDEIQKCPMLLDEIHYLIEERNIRFLLTGSSARKLKDAGVNLLGGRATERHMHPFTYPEIGNHKNYNLPFIFDHGLLPSIFLSDDPAEDLAAYTNTYLTEEIAAEGASRNLSAFSRFLLIAALTNARILNYSNIANDCKVSVQTITQWYDILEKTLIGYRVEAFTETVKRKAFASPKFYFFDIAVARYLKNNPVPNENTSEFGELFEQFICMELKAWIDYRSPRSKLTYWRSLSMHEVDFCIDDNLAIEVKASRNVSEKQLKGLKALREEGIFRQFVVVCQEEHPRIVDGISILPWRFFLEQLWYGSLPMLI